MREYSAAAGRLEGQKMFQILARARELEKAGANIIHFEIGDPDFDTPANVVEACCAALRKGDTHYSCSSGLAEFKEAAADVTGRSRGFRPDANQILVTPGANVQIYYVLACAVNPGEEVIITDPAFVSYNSILKFLDMRPVRVPLREENMFRLDPDDVEKAVTAGTRAVIINSPNNPTGSVLGESDMRRLYDIAEKYDIYLISDEVYARMIYKDSETGFFSPSRYDQCKKRTVVVHSFSKSYAMTGWRIGGVTAPAGLTEKMALLLETTSSCVSPFIQRAAIEALRGSQKPIDEMVERFRERRDIIVDGLNNLPGVRCAEPKGAFYAFPNIRGTGMSSVELSRFLMEKAGVAVCPGDCFGERGEGYVRLCYANSAENIREGLSRMRKALESL